MPFATRLLRCLLLIFAATTAPRAQAQLELAPGYESNAVLPICPANGQAAFPFAPDEAVTAPALRRARISSVTVSSAHDTAFQSPLNVLHYTPSGKAIPIKTVPKWQNFLTGYSATFTAKGELATLRYDWEFMAGCGTGGAWVERASVHRTYAYRHRRLVSTDERDTLRLPAGGFGADKLVGQRTEYRYDKKTRVIAERELYFGVEHPDTPSTWKYKQSQLDTKGRLLRTFSWNYLVPANADSLPLAPGSLAFSLLRDDPLWEDTVNRWLYGESDSMSDEAEEAMDRDIERRDSLDAGWLAFYSRSGADLVGYGYDAAGRVCERLEFKGDDLVQKDSLFYDRQGRLQRWLQYTVSGNYDRTAYRTVWDFRYSGHRVEQCRMELSVLAPTGGGAGRAFQFQEEQTYQLFYNGRGELDRLQSGERRAPGSRLAGAEEPGRSYHFRYEHF